MYIGNQIDVDTLKSLIMVLRREGLNIINYKYRSKYDDYVLTAEHKGKFANEVVDLWKGVDVVEIYCHLVDNMR